MKDLKWNIDLDSIKDPTYVEYDGDYTRARAQMMQRTRRHELYGLIAKNKSIHEWSTAHGSSKYFSEGSSQYILRKALSQTLQRVPDGELETQYDKASWEHIATQYIFDNKVLWSEFEGIDMLSNLTNAFKMSFTYGFAPVRTGFVVDQDNDPRIQFEIANWADVFINPDCKDVRYPQTVWYREYMTKADVEALLTPEGTVKDSTYKEDTIKYVIDHQLFSARVVQSEKQADVLKGSRSLASLTLLTRYDRGADEFITYVPGICAEFRRVPNYDPRKGLPWNFLVLEPDPDYPLGISQLEFLLADQQFQDLFQTSAYKNLMLALEPPIMVSGWDTNPASYKFEPRKIWNLGNNPNQVRVEPVSVETTTLTNWTGTREAVAAAQMRQLNMVDGNIAADAGIPGFSRTPQGVEAQQLNKEVAINQYQKRMEHFMSCWSNQALRMYINAMGGQHWLTVDETTRRKMFDISMLDRIDGDKILINFDELGTDLLEFKVRAGSLMQRKEDQERMALQETVQPFVQNLQGWSEENKAVIENEVLLPAAKRMLELSETDIGQTLAESLGNQIAQLALQEMEGQIAGQQEQLTQQGAQLDAMAAAMGPEMQEQLGQAIPPVPMEDEAMLAGEPPLDMDMGGATSPSLAPQPMPLEPPGPPLDMAGQPVTAGQNVNPYDLLDM